MEEPLCEYGACLLGSLNLAEFVPEGGKTFNYSDFYRAIKVSVKALNNVLDEGLPLHPLKEQRETAADWRQIGLGIMGLADMLIKMEIPYGSKESIELCNGIADTLWFCTLQSSNELAIKDGAYERFDKDVYDTEMFRRSGNDSDDFGFDFNAGLRNSQLLTIAPTGSISTMLGISGGIEPVFANSYTRRTESLHNEEKVYKVYTPIAQEYMEEHGLTEEEELPDFFVTSGNLDPFKRIKMQSTWQHYIDASISSTINLPNSATIEDVEEIYIQAWKMGLKGVTVFREGCQRVGILVSKPEEEKVEEETPCTSCSSCTDCSGCNTYNSITPTSRKTIGTTEGKTYCKKCACGTMYLTINRNEDNQLVETFVNTSKGGICQANIGAINRLISVALRSGVKVEEITDQLKGINCPACTKIGNKDGVSCPDIISRTLLEAYKDTLEQPVTPKIEPACEVKEEQTPVHSNGVPCPDCNETVIHEGGCVTCLNCGWSKCS